MLALSQYESVKWIVKQNAYIQAKGDSETFPYHRIEEVINDPMASENAVRVLRAWALTQKVEYIFVNVLPSLKEKLSDIQRQALIDYWIKEYYTKTLSLLKERYTKEGTNGFQSI